MTENADESKSIAEIGNKLVYVLSSAHFERLFFIFFGVSPCSSAPDEEVRAQFFMEELNNGVKLCKLIGALQARVAQGCPSALRQVSQTGGGQKTGSCLRGGGGFGQELCR